ncbi:hypothetical protein F2Q70_00013222 [Brassica cretica]|uniref:Uncharacterized protein n=1 Tax=Brassica cretica TaxID=69181 RepID=A0A8S9LWV4_BRACR|nr:hypothetical protein F2Q70_00013222 [Brassica cretica]
MLPPPASMLDLASTAPPPLRQWLVCLLHLQASSAFITISYLLSRVTPTSSNVPITNLIQHPLDSSLQLLKIKQSVLM